MVLFVTYSGAFGGAERLLVDFASGLEGECAIACPPGPLTDAAAAAGLRTFRLRARSLRLRGGPGRAARAVADLAGHALELRRLARDLDPEVLVAWSMRSLLGAAVAGSKVHARPLAFQHNDFLPGPPLGTLVRRAATRAQLITAPSRAVLDDLDPGGRLGARARVIAPGVEVARFAGGAAGAGGVAGAGGAGGGATEILVLGAITAWKRPELALDVLARVRERVPSARLRLAGEPLPGDGEVLLGKLRERAAALGVSDGVELPGRVDAAQALAGAGCLLHCAEREPFGIAVLEALAAGRPAIVPDAGGPAEIVEDSCGRRYAPGDAAGAATAVTEVLSDRELSARLGAAGRARAATEFELGRQRARYAAAIGSLAGARPGPPRRRLDPQALALITVTHNSAGELSALLGSVARHLPGAAVFVADCASGDDSVAVARAHPQAVVLELPNVGFGTATNRALAEVRQPVTILVNPDVVLIDSSLLELAAEAADTGSPERLLAPLVLNPDGSRQDTVHPRPLSPPDVARSLVPPAALPGPLGTALAPWRSGRPRAVGWAVGCALAARTDTLRRLGPFDERIFLYGEDMELGLRAARAGVATWFWPAARVVHRGGHSIEAAHAGEAFELRARARHDALALAMGGRAAALDDALQALTFASRLALKRALRRPGGRERRQLAAVRARRR